MVTPQQIDRILEPNFEGQNDGQDLDWEASAIDIVSEKKILGGLQGSARILVDYFDEIVELSVDIPNYCHWILNSN